jgi:uncharacterized membrane protein
MTPSDHASLPTSINDYLDALRRALDGADPALVQDALYDAEEYLRSELAEHPEQSEAEVIAAVAGSYGAPEEVAEIYRDTEVKVQTALRAPATRPRQSAFGRFFGVVVEPRTYSALFYMLLALATGIAYFTFVVVGLSVSLGLSIVIVGIPLLVLYFGLVRVLSLVEGRMVEVMLGERMPRRPLYSQRGKPWLKRIGEMFTDPRTWSTQLYFLLMLPLGVAYFVIVVTGISTGLGMVFGSVAHVVGGDAWVQLELFGITPPVWAAPIVAAVGAGIVLLTLHAARLVGWLHGQLAKALLVKSAQY